MMLPSITTDIKRNDNFLRITKIFGGSSDFTNWESGGCPVFFPLICILHPLYRLPRTGCQSTIRGRPEYHYRYSPTVKSN